LTSQRHDPRAVIVVDNPSGTPVLLKLYTTQHKEVWVATSRTTQINVTFDGGLFVEAYPLYPLSDAAPRRAYLPSDGNLTIRVTPPAIGGAIQLFQAIISVAVGLLATLGILKHVTKTPTVSAVGSTSSINLMVSMFFIPTFSICFIPLLIVFDLVTITIILLMFINPIVFLFFKSCAVISNMEGAMKVGLLHLYDVAVLIWILLWLINPIPTIFKPEFISSVPFLILLFLISLTLGGLLAFVALIVKIIGSETLFLSIIPFIMNEELAARVEFCRKALDKPTKVRVYPEEKEEHVEGFVVECNIEKIAIGNDKSTRLFSWGDVQQIERL